MVKTCYPLTKMKLECIRKGYLDLKWAIFGLFFFILSFNTVDSKQMFHIKVC